ncbi:MAG: hypothetical protein HXX14_18660 [Bacteroidetes bacterium]|nr:hypothetical protein [Bacteroidota bacterium]
METQSETNPTCCPVFDPIPWDDKVFEWENKKFIKASVCTLFYMPLNFGRIMKKIDKKMKEVGAETPDWVCLSDHTSKWNMDLYLAVDKDIPNIENTTLSGKFYSKVYEGLFKDTGKWTKDFENILSSKGLSKKRSFMWYTTCPKCAKKYGKNYIVIVSQID